MEYFYQAQIGLLSLDILKAKQSQANPIKIELLNGLIHSTYIILVEVFKVISKLCYYK